MSRLQEKAEANLDNPDLFERMVLASPEEILELCDEIAGLRELLEEAVEWFARPVATQEDAAMFLAFEERAKEVVA
jgi:hypothetical protein